MTVCLLGGKVPREEGHQPAYAVNLRLYFVVVEVAGQSRVVVLDNHGDHFEDDF